MSTDDKNTASPTHPHEPAIPPTLDAEGRCLVCGLLVQIDKLKRELAEWRKAAGKETPEECAKGIEKLYNNWQESQRIVRELRASRSAEGELNGIRSADGLRDQPARVEAPGPAEDGGQVRTLYEEIAGEPGPENLYTEEQFDRMTSLALSLEDRLNAAIHFPPIGESAASSSELNTAAPQAESTADASVGSDGTRSGQPADAAVSHERHSALADEIDRHPLTLRLPHKCKPNSLEVETDGRALSHDENRAIVDALRAASSAKLTNEGDSHG